VPLLNVVLVPAPDQVVVRLTGDADLSTVPLLSDALAQAADLGTPHVVVDVAAARFWDSSALRALAAAGAELAEAGRACRIVGAGAATRRLIRAAGLADSLALDGPVYQRVAPEPAAPARPPRHPASLRTAPSLRPARTPVGAIPLHRWS
jgi:anti-anti-sigma factor